MKALFISNDPTVFDAASTTRARMREYAKAIGTLHVLSRGPGGLQEEEDGALTLHRAGGGKLFGLLFLLFAARRIIREKGIEVVSAQDPFEHGYIAAEAVKGTKARLHLQVHTDFLSPWFTREGVFRSLRIRAPRFNRLRVSIADRTLPRAHAVRAVSERVKRSIIERYGERVVEPSVVPIAVPSVLPPPEPLPPHPFGFAFMTSGRLEPEKRIEDILMALGKLGLHYQNVGLIIVGEGSERPRLQTLARKLGLAERVLFMGEQGAKAPALMRSAQGYIQASAYEGYSRTLIEAALARLPIITTDVGIVGEVFRGYEHVLATPPGDSQNLAAHMTAVIGDQALRRSLVLAAENAAKAHLAGNEQNAQRVADDLARALQ